MTFLTNLGILCIFGLAIWKLYELFFGAKQSKELKKAKEVQQLLNMFFAEFTYKTMNSSEEYKPAPEDIYIWLNKNFQEWSESYMKRKIEELKNQ